MFFSNETWQWQSAPGM